MNVLACCCEKECSLCEIDPRELADEDDIEVIETLFGCEVTVEGDVEIVDGCLRIAPGGSVTTTAEASLVTFDVRAAAAGAKAKLSMGDVTATITFGADNDDGIMALDGTGLVASTNQLANVEANEIFKAFSLCIGEVATHAGARLYRFSDSRPPLAAQLTTDSPAYPYGVIKLEAETSAVEFGRVRLRDTDDGGDAGCTECKPNICPIFVDDAGTPPNFHPFSASNGQWVNVGGFGIGGDLDNTASASNAIAVAQVPNPDGLGVGAFFVFWIWDTGEGEVRIRLGCNSSGVGGYVLAVSNFSPPGKSCTRLYKDGGSTLVTELENNLAGNPVGTFYLYGNGSDVWVGESSAVSPPAYIGLHNDTSWSGGHVAIGTGNIDTGAKVTFYQADFSWHAHAPNHTACATDPRYCGLIERRLGDVANITPTDQPCDISLDGTWLKPGDDLYTEEDGATIETSWAYPEENAAFATYYFAHGIGADSPARGNKVTLLTGGNPIIVEHLGALSIGEHYLYQFLEVTMGGSTGIAVQVSSNVGTIFGYQMMACFGSARIRLENEQSTAFHDGYAGFTSVDADGTAGTGKGWGMEATTLVGGEQFYPRQIDVAHTSETQPNNEFIESTFDPCIDCYNPSNTDCGDDVVLPDTLRVTFATIGGFDFGTPPVMSAGDLGILLGTHTAIKTLRKTVDNTAQYQIYLGPTDRGDVEDMIDGFTCDGESVTPMVAFVYVSIAGGNATVTVEVLFACQTPSNVGGQVLGSRFEWEGTEASIDCESFSVDAVSSTLITYNDQIEVTVETL